jgi:hypothetical protein
MQIAGVTTETPKWLLHAWVDHELQRSIRAPRDSSHQDLKVTETWGGIDTSQHSSEAT